VTTSDNPVLLAERLFAYLGSGDLEAASGLFAPSVDFSIPGVPEVPWIPQVDSPAGMLEFFTLLGTHLERKQFEINRVLADGDDVVALGRLVSTVRATGRDIVSRFVLHLGARNGLIYRYHLYEDSWAVARALGRA